MFKILKIKKKFCKKCKIEKLLIEFYDHGCSDWCKECWKIYNKIYNQRNYRKTYHKTYMRIYRETHKNYYKIWHKIHQDKLNAKIAYIKHEIYRKAHQDHYNALTAKYLANKDQRTPPWADLKAMKKFYVKAIRLTKKTGVQYDVDHIIPLHGKNVSGLHVKNNLQIITHKKNVRKNNSWII